MVIARDVSLGVYPPKYRNHIYDIVNLFYKGEILGDGQAAAGNGPVAVSGEAGSSGPAAAGSGSMAPGKSAAPGGPAAAGSRRELRAAGRGYGGPYDSIRVTLSPSGFFDIDCEFNRRAGSLDVVETETRIGEGESEAETRICVKAETQIGEGETDTLISVKSETQIGEGVKAPYELKMAVYGLLKEHVRKEYDENFSLPWGALVGIRPIKIYADLLKKGVSGRDAAAEMARIYDVSERVSELCMHTASIQNEILSAYNPETDFMLYIGVPFCASKCAYCSFPSDAHNKAADYAPGYIDALLNEIEFIAVHTRGAGLRLRAVYVGGGTPTALGPVELKRLLGGVERAFPCEAPGEYTVEAGRADTISREKLEIILEHTNFAKRVRVCINPQTMNDSTLRLIDRRHTAEDAGRAFLLARGLGFKDINMDIIAGLPGERAADFENTLEAISRLGPDGFTAHTLCIKRSSRFNEFYGEYAYPDAAEAAGMHEAARRYAEKLGMAPYYIYRQKNTVGNLANIGYAAAGHECIYNIHEMADSLDVFAAGAGAVSKFVSPRTGAVDRVFNVKNLLEYISRTDEMIERKLNYLAYRRKDTDS